MVGIEDYVGQEEQKGGNEVKEKMAKILGLDHDDGWDRGEIREKGDGSVLCWIYEGLGDDEREGGMREMEWERGEELGRIKYHMFLPPATLKGCSLLFSVCEDNSSGAPDDMLVDTKLGEHCIVEASMLYIS